MTEFSPHDITLSAESHWQNWQADTAGARWHAVPADPLPHADFMHRLTDTFSDTKRIYEPLRLTDMADAGDYRKGKIVEINQGDTLASALTIAGTGTHDVIRMMVDERRTDEFHLEEGRRMSAEAFNRAAERIERAMEESRLVVCDIAWHLLKVQTVAIGRRLLFGIPSTSGGQIIVADGDMRPEAGQSPHSYTHLSGRLAVGRVYTGNKAGADYWLKVVRAQLIPLTRHE